MALLGVHVYNDDDDDDVDDDYDDDSIKMIRRITDCFI
jgi:hypothetical protein